MTFKIHANIAAVSFVAWLVVLGASSAYAQPQLSVSATEVPAGEAITATIVAPGGYNYALLGSTRDSGLVYGGVALGIGLADLKVIAIGVIGPGGSVSVPVTPPLGDGVDVYHLLGVISGSGDFVPPIPSATIGVRQRALYTNTPTFLHGLSAGGHRVTDVAPPTLPNDAVSKTYVDAYVNAYVEAYVDPSTVILGSQMSQPVSSGGPLLHLEQTGAGDLLNLRTNSASFPGSGGINPNAVQFRVLPDGGFYAAGRETVGVIPTTGAGNRLMWYPGKGAFRAGGVPDTSADAWDDANVGTFSWAGGTGSRATQSASFAFGNHVTASAAAAVALGANHVVSGVGGFATGVNNQVSGATAIAMGSNLQAVGERSVAIGNRVHACANNSVVIGSWASTADNPFATEPCNGNLRTGSIVLADGSITDFVAPQANNQFVVRAAGGTRIHTNAIATVGVRLNAGGSSWEVISDRSAKYDFAPVDGNDLLRRLIDLPISSFRYKDGDGTRYIGPVAQDFHAAFGLGSDDKTIRTMDVDGVTLASLQALGRQVHDLRGDNERLEDENRELHRLLDDVLKRLERVETNRK